jgi:FMN phosphatase YigB (HAD superfamily)
VKKAASSWRTEISGEDKIAVAPEMLRNIRGIIFDFDGTLFDNRLFPFYLIMANPLDVFRIWKERLVRRQFEGCDALTSEAYYNNFFSALGKICFQPAKRVRHWYFIHYMPRMIRVIRKHYKLRPMVKELLERFEAPPGSAWGLPSDFPSLAVYSDYPMLKERFEAVGVKPGSRLRLYGPECFGAQKPAPRPFQCIARDMGLRPEEILVIGDREDTDGQGAFNAGMRFFCLETGRRRHFRLDPYRNYLPKDGLPSGPILPMYSGTWDNLIEMFKNNLFLNNSQCEKKIEVASPY